MRDEGSWRETKFVRSRGRLRATRDPKIVGVSSRLVADLVASAYERHLPVHATGRLLDLGCGRVPLYAAYRDLVSDVFCVDWGGSLHKNEHLDLEHDITQPIPLEDGRFDTIILSDVLEHIAAPEQLWAEMARLLAPGGKIIMNVPFMYWLHEQPHDFYRYTEFALRRFVAQAGLTLVLVESLGGAPEVVADIVSKIVRRVPLLGVGVSRSIQAFTSWIIRTGAGRRASASTRDSFPIGYFLVAQMGTSDA